MFDIGFLELLILGVVGLLVLGPERLPRAARTAGLWVGRIKRSVSDMQREINSQLEAEELRQKLDEQQKKLDEGVDRVKRDVEGLAETKHHASDETPPPPRESSMGASPEAASGHIDADRRPDAAASQDADKDTTSR
ncbi:Sec-independent protein translocase protein TatB [Halomonas sp. I1]|uniref:Sec-independent protein translocase protein TatB n=1 Tax=Halomonas sp. I1 TaxID=393536 RepID=UPI0028DF2312|nr:Sec-independent protein translocase protein TatB [Halomonas sp. I1]MDT8895037.1 Sec-independent protein translocase protein TatB [Halomonas sp. I1]